MTPYYERDGITIYHGDCRDVLPTLAAESVALVLTDPPYGLTNNAWDVRFDLWALLGQFRTVVMTAAQPFAAEVIVGNMADFRHEWIWHKHYGSNFLNSVREPMKEHESVLVFSHGGWTYNPQREGRTASGEARGKYRTDGSHGSPNYGAFASVRRLTRPAHRLPSSVQSFVPERGLHPTQKPLSLMRYLVQTYSNHGDCIVDPFGGSGTTARAALDLGRRCILVEREEAYCRIAVTRLQQLPLEVVA